MAKAPKEGSTTKFCVDCKFYNKRIFRKPRCIRVLERDPVTGEAINIRDEDVQFFRHARCKGTWYEQRLPHRRIPSIDPDE
jgi:hypothetical protein